MTDVLFKRSADKHGGTFLCDYEKSWKEGKPGSSSVSCQWEPLTEVGTSLLKVCGLFLSRVLFELTWDMTIM